MRYVVKGINSYWGKADLTLHYITIRETGGDSECRYWNECGPLGWEDLVSEAYTGPDFSATN